jgi:hypothetical protein
VETQLATGSVKTISANHETIYQGIRTLRHGKPVPAGDRQDVASPRSQAWQNRYRHHVLKHEEEDFARRLLERGDQMLVGKILCERGNRKLAIDSEDWPRPTSSSQEEIRQRNSSIWCFTER